MCYMIMFTRHYANSPKLSTILCELHVVMIALTKSTRQILLNCRSYCTCSIVTSCRSTGLMFYMIIFTRYYTNSPNFSIILYGQHVVIIILTRHHTNSPKLSTMLLHIVIITHLQSTIRILPNFRL
jgi:hypothetical protein